MNSLERLWTSTLELHNRFYPDNPPPFEARRRVLFEEFGEFTHSLNADEAADLIVTIMGILAYKGWTCEDLEDAIEFVASKNDAKTLDTHCIRADGKIARK